MLIRFLTVIAFVLAIVASVAVTLLVTGRDAGNAVTAGGGSIDEEGVRAVVADYLVNNPDVIVEAFTVAQQRKAQEEAQKSEEAIGSKKNELENDKGSPFAGNPNGDVVIVKFSDYNCGYCKRVAPDMDKLLKEDKNLKVVMKDFPILGQRSVVNSKAAIAVFNLAPEKWWDFHMQMLRTTPQNDQQLYALVEKQGIDVEKVKAEMEAPAVQEQIRKNMTLGTEIGVRGTPAFVINGEFIRGAIGIDQMKERIAAARS